MNKIGIICYYSFPEGMAATNRIIAYCKGLNANQVETEIFIFRPKVGKEEPSQGYIDNIRYIYAHVRKVNCSLFRKILYERPVTLLKTLVLIKKSHNEKPFDTILLSYDTPFLLFFFGISLRLLIGVKIGFIADEYPLEIREYGKSEISLASKLWYKIAFFFISYRILIHEKLRDYFNREIGNKPSYIMGSIIDEKRFEIDLSDIDNGGDLCYFGGMALNNDNVDLLIKVFNKIKDKYPNLNLLFYGTPSDKDRIFLMDMINCFHLQERVFLKGRISYNEVPKMMKQAAVLVTSQSNTKRAEGGLPTKLAEYLISGRPAIVSKVSVIPEILSDRENIYMVEPDNVENYINTLEEVLSNYDVALNVAKKGQLFAIHNYGNIHVCKQLKEFLSSQINKK